MRLHFKIAASNLEYRVPDFESELVSGERQDKIQHPEMSTFHSDKRSLLGIGKERTVEGAVHPSLKKQFG